MFRSGFLIIYLVITCFPSVYSQGVIIDEAPAVAEMMKAFESYNRKHPEIRGWRIQLLATTDRQKLDWEMGKFRSLYPDIPVEWTHTKPFYKLRAGAFVSRLEANRMLARIKEDFPRAYHTMDMIKLSEISF